MKKTLAFSIFILSCLVSYSQSNLIYSNGYFNSRTGTYVEPYYKTSPNNTNHDNWSTSGNYNPKKETYGTKAPDYSPAAYNYGGNQVIQTGPRGGQYYINRNGNKIYVPKR